MKKKNNYSNKKKNNFWIYLIIIFTLLLIIGGVIAFFIIRKYNSNLSTWGCNDNNECEKMENGGYSSRKECEASPCSNVGYKCNNLKCVESILNDDDFFFDTLTECNENCNQNTSVYRCINNKCEECTEDKNECKIEEECESKCGKKIYECNNGICITVPAPSSGDLSDKQFLTEDNCRKGEISKPGCYAINIFSPTDNTDNKNPIILKPINMNTIDTIDNITQCLNYNDSADYILQRGYNDPDDWDINKEYLYINGNTGCNLDDKNKEFYLCKKDKDNKHIYIGNFYGDNYEENYYYKLDGKFLFKQKDDNDIFWLKNDNDLRFEKNSNANTDNFYFNIYVRSPNKNQYLSYGDEIIISKYDENNDDFFNPNETETNLENNHNVYFYNGMDSDHPCTSVDKQYDISNCYMYPLRRWWGGNTKKYKNLAQFKLLNN